MVVEDNEWREAAENTAQEHSCKRRHQRGRETWENLWKMCRNYLWSTANHPKIYQIQIQLLSTSALELQSRILFKKAQKNRNQILDLLQDLHTSQTGLSSWVNDSKQNKKTHLNHKRLSGWCKFQLKVNEERRKKHFRPAFQPKQELPRWLRITAKTDMKYESITKDKTLKRGGNDTKRKYKILEHS